MFKDEADLPHNRSVKLQEQRTLNDGKLYMIEISVTKTKLIIIAARPKRHRKIEFPKP